jgi:4-amino-4-deoxy-L-arabinose transferase-like glycosyltransferase
MSFLRRNFDYAILAILISGFAFVASQRLGSFPVPGTDESYTLQVSYEMLYRGKLALPMYRYLGGNIENVWHSYTPVFFVLLAGYSKLAGWGLLEGRVFNLITALLTILMVYLIGRRLFDWRVAVAATIMLISDTTFLEQSRMVRNDFAAAFFALLAYYLYELAERRTGYGSGHASLPERRRGGEHSLQEGTQNDTTLEARRTHVPSQGGWYYLAAGLAAGAGVMCHTNILYILGAVWLLMLLTHGRGVFRTTKLYQFTGGAFIVMAYEIVYDLIDYRNFRLQNRGDTLHFGVFELWGWWLNIVNEPIRYWRWSRGWKNFFELPQTPLLIFQVLTIAAILYLITVWVLRLKSGGAMASPRVRVLTVTVSCVLFHAAITSHKDTQYMIHLAGWFALCVAIMLCDGLNLIGRLKKHAWPRARLVHRVALAAVALTILAYGDQLVKQNKAYLDEVLVDDLASFDEFKTVLRSIVPEGVCPVAVKDPELWLVFPEFDHCFATIEARMKDAVDIDGRDYALITRRGASRAHWVEKPEEKYHQLGTLKDSPYGDLFVYYTGVNQAYLSVTPRTYYFFGERRGHFSDEQLTAAKEVWSANAGELTSLVKTSDSTMTGDGLEIKPTAPGKRGAELVELSKIAVKPDTIYRLNLDLTSAAPWELIVYNETTGTWMIQQPIPERAGQQQIVRFIKSLGTEGIKLLLRPLDPRQRGSIRVARVSLHEVAPLQGQ